MSQIKVSLYEIATTFAGLEALVENGEVSPQDAADTFEAIEGDFTQKVEQVLGMYRNYLAFGVAAADEAARLAVLAQSAKKRAEWLREYIKTQMQRTGKKSVKTLNGTCSIVDGSPSVLVEDVLLIPDEFIDYVPEDAMKPKRREILAALKAGVEVPGATMVTGEEIIKISGGTSRKAASSEEGE